MRIFSNFDTKFLEKILQSKISHYSEKNVLVVRRSKYYFIFRVFIPIIILMFGGYVVYMYLGQESWLKYIRVPLFIVWFLVLWFRPIHKLLKYLYDFTIIDPTWVTTYKQKGILKSYLKEIPANRIRSIEIERTNILENVFGYGKVNILTDFIENMHIGEDRESASLFFV